MKRAARWVALSTPVVLIAAFSTQVAIAWGALPPMPPGFALPVNLTVVALYYALLAACTWAFVKVAELSPSPSDRATFWIRTGMIALAILAPLAAVLSLRLSFEACPVLNLFGLPWPAVPKVLVRTICALILVGTVASMIAGLQSLRFRAAAIFVAAYSAVMVFPGFVLLFLLIYGDPGPNCVAG